MNVISAKCGFVWRTDSNGFITKAKARLVARGFGQQPGVDYFEMFAPTPATSSIKVILAVLTVQQDWKLHHWDVKQTFLNAELDVEVYKKLPGGCGEMSGKVLR